MTDLRHNNNASLGNKRGNTNGRPSNYSSIATQEPPRRSPGAVEKVQFRRPEPARQEPPLRQPNLQKPQSSSLQVKPRGMLNNNKQSKPSSYESGPGRPLKAVPPQKPSGDMKPKQNYAAVERRPTASQMDVSALPMPRSSQQLLPCELCDSLLFFLGLEIKARHTIFIRSQARVGKAKGL
jgi:hypothetical protein